MAGRVRYEIHNKGEQKSWLSVVDDYRMVVGTYKIDIPPFQMVLLIKTDIYK